MSATHTNFAAKLLALLVVASWCSLAQVEKRPEEVKIGQTVAEVHALLGMPDLAVTGDNVTERWTISPHNIVQVRFDDGKVGWIERPGANPHPVVQATPPPATPVQATPPPATPAPATPVQATATPTQPRATPEQATPAPTPDPKTLVVTAPAPAVPFELVKVGQTVAEVHALLGMPTINADTMPKHFTQNGRLCRADCPKDMSHTETWGIALHDALNVRFDDGKVAWTEHFDPKPPQASGGCGGLAPSEKPKSGWQKFSDGVNGHQPSYVGRRQQAQAEEQRRQRAQIAEQQRANCLQQIENERLQRQIDELRKQQTKEPVKEAPKN
jgi:hypothetical protein